MSYPSSPENNGTAPPDSGLPPLRARTAKPARGNGPPDNLRRHTWAIRDTTKPGIHIRPAKSAGNPHCVPTVREFHTDAPAAPYPTTHRPSGSGGRPRPPAPGRRNESPCDCTPAICGFRHNPPDAPYSAGTGRAEIAEPRPNSLRRPLPGAPGRTDGNEAARCLTAPNPRPDKVPPHRRRTATPGPK